MISQCRSNKGNGQVQQHRQPNRVRRNVGCTRRRFRREHIILWRQHFCNPKTRCILKSMATTAGTRRISLPSRLPRPAQADVNPKNIEKIVLVGTELEGEHPRVIREALRELSNQFIAGLHSADVRQIPRPLTERVAIPVNDITPQRSICPTHILAVPSTLNVPGASQSSSQSQLQSPTPSTSKLTLYPVHSAVLTANCTTLPFFPRSAASTRAGTSMPLVTMPIVHLNVPSPQSFPYVLSYLYTKDTATLHQVLVPEGLDAEGAEGALKQVITIRGVWSNLCALGVVDEVGDQGVSVFDVIDQTWIEVLDLLKKHAPVVEHS